MAILGIKKYPNPILRKKSKEVKEITPEIKQLAQDLIETMLKSEPEGIGLAAPQVGVSKRVIAVAAESGPAVLVNPNNPQEIAGAIKQVISNSVLATELVEKGLENIKRFSWQETADKTWKILSK